MHRGHIMLVDVVSDITASDQPETVMCRGLAEALGELWRTFGSAFDTYRPELYYMRGPGPKSRAKHSVVAAAALRPDAFHAASNILTRVARRKLPNRASL
jgi:hypothetical protein